ncbi:MAG: hypothetical protein KatS3mg102_1134 [Planctomycetota bacterium]|nr:MAG: hypothetical protein KatS3mg102_1134 [Planctomycetota bacterium]
MRLQLVIAFLLGIIAALLGVLVFGQPAAQPVWAQTAAGAGGLFGVTANTDPGSTNMIWLIDTRTEDPKLSIYEMRESRLNLVAVRNIKYDQMYDQYPGQPNAQRPSVDQVRKEVMQRR